ncbi:MAG: right-handed parallel beta-helix repeat-containing protein [Planctomycetia bacterium]|nr:right-handed parallel beta-helix repeat-containing protein [Planctomycetia bacterium]
MNRFLCAVVVSIAAWFPICFYGVAATNAADLSHPPMRLLPAASSRPLAEGRALYADAANGNDAQDGSRERPWHTVNHALRRLLPGDVLYLRGGTYYENVVLPKSGAEGKPITIRSYPGELAVIDGGLREFLDTSATAWIPFAEGAEGEFVSAVTYPQFMSRPIVAAFPSEGWEPLYGKEDERPLVLGHFADSMVPLHGYRTANDLRDTSMLWDVDNKFQNDEGVYCGPGLWFNRETERIHIRLAHTTLEGLGTHAYRGETDPRKLPLCISGPYGNDVLRINGVNHIVLQDIVLRGASGSPLINLYGSDWITLDGLTMYGGSPGLLANASSNVRIVNSAFRGLAAPWSSRPSMKYRGTPSYRIITQRAAPESHDWEIDNCEFTDDHDGIWLRHVHHLKFHHNFVDNSNDDGIEVGARKRDQLLYIYQNLISRCQITFTLHEMEPDESPATVDDGSGVYITRNVIDLRRGTFKGPPKEPDPSGSYLDGDITLCGDHGGPTWPNYFFYHNTVLRTDTAWRGYYGFGMGGQGTRATQRRVFNNLFVQIAGIPGLSFASGPDDIFVDGNLHWGIQDGPEYEGDFFKQQSRGPAFQKMPMPAGWMVHDQFANPKLNEFGPDPAAQFDISLRKDSPAIDAGVMIQDEWFDPLQAEDGGLPDIGALPHDHSIWPVGIHGRIQIGAAAINQ